MCTPTRQSHQLACALRSIFREGLARVDQKLGDPESPLFEPEGWATSTEPKNQADMIALAKKQNPVLGFWDPLNIITEETQPETIG